MPLEHAPQDKGQVKSSIPTLTEHLKKNSTTNSTQTSVDTPQTVTPKPSSSSKFSPRSAPKAP